MLDIGWTELLVIAVILIVVVGPKDLPPMIRAFGKMTKRLRQTAGEFRAQFDEALREAELDDLKRSVDDVRSLNPANSIREALNPLRQMGQEIKSDLERSTRFEPKSDAEDEGAQNSILPELPFALDEPPRELTPAAQQSVPSAPAAQPAASTAPPVTGTAPAQAAPAAAPATAAPVPAPVTEKKPATRKAAAKSAGKAETSAKSPKAGGGAATAVAEVSKAKATKSKAVTAGKPAAKAVAAKEPAPKPAAKPRKSKSEDRA